jgi:hypothetical protein
MVVQEPKRSVVGARPEHHDATAGFAGATTKEGEQLVGMVGVGPVALGGMLQQGTDLLWDAGR